MSEDEDVLRIVDKIHSGELTIEQAVRRLGNFAHSAARQDPRFRSRVEDPSPRPLIFRRPVDG
ncbi:MAG TPA: hypothetical protein VEO96_00545 [Thermoplasmata archaeon]|nr:hypothetical protein [Thermoplasmata archaeon]